MDTLLSIAEFLLDKVCASANMFPVGIRQIVTHIQKETATVFPEMKDVVLGVFIFLRFICPALVSPVSYGMIEEGVLSKEHQRALILISKLLQVT